MFLGLHPVSHRMDVYGYRLFYTNSDQWMFGAEYIATFHTFILGCLLYV